MSPLKDNQKSSTTKISGVYCEITLAQILRNDFCCVTIVFF